MDVVKHVRRYQFDELLWFLSQPNQAFLLDNQQIHFNHTTHYLRIVRQSPYCLCCGVRGTHWWLMRKGQTYWLNLYARIKTGQEVLLTMDHIKPKSKGGFAHINNLQVLCWLCNWAKRDDEIDLKTLRQRLTNRQFSLGQTVELLKQPLIGSHTQTLSNPFGVIRAVSGLTVEVQPHCHCMNKRIQTWQKSMVFTPGKRRLKSLRHTHDTCRRHLPRFEEQIRFLAYLKAEADGFRESAQHYWLLAEREIR